MKRILYVFAGVAAAAGGWALGLSTALPEAATSARSPGTSPAAASVSPGLSRGQEVDQAMQDSADPVKSAREWARRHPQSFLAWLQRTRPQPPEEVIEAFFGEWAQADVDAAFTAAHNLPARFGLVDSRLLFRRLVHITETDARAAFRWVGRVEGQIGTGPILRLAIEDHSTIDFSEVTPEEAAAGLRGIPVTQTAAKLARRYAEWLAAKDLPAARRWAESLEAEFRGVTMGPVLRRWTETDRTAALAYLQTGASSLRQEFATLFCDGTSGRTPQAELAWLQECLGILPPGGTVPILARWAGTDSAAATEYVLEIEDPHTRTGLLRSLAMSRAGDVAGTFQWIDTLPAAERPATLGAVTPGMVLLNFPAFRTHLEQLPPDEGVAVIRSAAWGLNHMRTADREVLFQWAVDRPGDEGKRALEDIVRLWKTNFFPPGTAATAVATIPAGPKRELAERVLNEK